MFNHASSSRRTSANFTLKETAEADIIQSRFPQEGFPYLYLMKQLVIYATDMCNFLFYLCEV